METNMAEIEELARRPKATFKPLRKIEKGLHEGDPMRVYEGLARYVTTLIGGPNFKHDSISEETNRQLFIETLEKSIDVLKRGETREAVSTINTWSTRWRTEDAKALLPEHLMPVAMLTEGVIKSAFDDSVVFVSPGLETTRILTVKRYLDWAHKTMLANGVDVRQFFKAQDVHKVLPFRTVTVESQATH